MKRVLNRALAAVLVAIGLNAVPVEAAVVPQDSPLKQKAMRQPELFVPEVHQRVTDVPALAAGLQSELAQLGVGSDSGFYDSRSGRWSSLIMHQPLIPGTGFGNHMQWGALAGASGRPDDKVLGDHLWNALRNFLREHQGQLRVDTSELGAPRIGIHEDGQLIFVYAQRVVGGIPVRDSYLGAAINHGNLVLLGFRNWADVNAPRAATVPAERARAVVSEHVSPHLVTSFGREQRLEIVPTLRDGYYDYRLAWVVPATVMGDIGTWEALVDAVSGDLLLFEDRNQYASRQMIGGVYPVSNDQRPPDGVEQTGWPLPFADVVIGGNTIFTTTGGTFGCNTGNATTALSGRYIRISDGCGQINETTPTDFNLGSGPNPTDTDCAIPAGHSAGDTKSARTGFYELGRINEQARAYMPANGWLQGQLNSNMNIPSVCNAFWDGSSVNFFRSAIASGCRNTGEIAGVFDHEWGHGLDNNNTNPSISQPGEAIADIRAHLRLATSCVGRGFYINQVCTGYGDACDGNPATGCTGIRDDDFIAHRCNLPHTIDWARTGFPVAQCNPAAPACPNGGGTPCGKETHCEGYVAGETSWDLYARDLQAPPFSFDANTALELATRLMYVGTDNLGAWYGCSQGPPPCQTAGTCGCGATNGYLLMLVTDDDNGNINDGTPHISAIRAAFERHQIACTTPAPVNSGCVGGPTTAPTVTATPAQEGVNLSWAAVTGATRYYVYRAEGLAGCNFGKVKVGDVTTTSFSDTNLLSGRPYSYIVIPGTANNACFGRASTCTSATPTPATCVAQSVAPQALTVDAAGNGVFQPGETVVMSPTWRNTGAGPVTLTGALSNFTGPAGPVYTIVDGAADYGTIPANQNQGCTNCYSVGVNNPARPAQHWDSTVLETVTPTGTTKNWVLHIGNSFTDVPGTSGFYRFIETIFHKAITGGCGGTSYCPGSSTAREQMAVFVLISKEGAGYNPPACSPPNLFTDVPETSPFCRFIEELANRGVVAGCGGGAYCPGDAVTREQMAVFVLRTLDPALNPPACTTPMFNDVPASSPFCKWIEELARRGVVVGCGGGNYCPTQPVTREQMAVFLAATFSLVLYGL